MKKDLPIKVIDDILEAPALWRYYGLKQEYRAGELATWPGVRSQTLDQINMNLFSSIASKLIKHIPGKNSFAHLKTNFTLTDSSWGTGWIHQDEPQYNVAGLIFLNPNPPPNSGTLFYQPKRNIDHDYNEQFFAELAAAPEDRKQYEKYKLEQRTMFKKTMTVGNVFNRCIMFSPEEWHSGDTYFGDTLETTRLTIVFTGTAV